MINKVLKLYVQVIEDFEEELGDKYKISNDFWDKSGVNFPKEGATDNFKYSYHGAGCKIERQGIICEYDVAPLNGNNIKFSPWKFFNFINTNPDLDDISREDLELGLSLLIKEEKISKLFIDGIETGVYQVLDSPAVP